MLRFCLIFETWGQVNSTSEEKAIDLSKIPQWEWASSRLGITEVYTQGAHHFLDFISLIQRQEGVFVPYGFLQNESACFECCIFG